MKMIEVHNLTKDYGNYRGIFDLSFTVDQGEVVGFLGSNGAGKTTTIRHLMGFIHPQQGISKILIWIRSLRQSKYNQKLVIYREKYHS